MSKIHPLAVLAAMPSVFEPMTASQAQEPFSNPDWLFEPKWDGFRAICFLIDGKVRLVSTNGKNLTDRFRELRNVAELIKADAAVYPSASGIIHTGLRGVSSSLALEKRQSLGWTRDCRNNGS